MILRENPSWEKSRGGGEFHCNLKFTRVRASVWNVSVCENRLWKNWRSLRLGSSSFLLPFLIGEVSLYVLLLVTGEIFVTARFSRAD